MYLGPTFPPLGAFYAVYAIVTFSRHDDSFKTGECAFLTHPKIQSPYSFLPVPMQLPSSGIKDFALSPEVPSRAAGKARPLWEEAWH